MGRGTKAFANARAFMFVIPAAKTLRDLSTALWITQF
jgi:hypothetical protein